MRLDHIQLAIPAGTEPQQRAFWVGILGFDELEKPDALKPRGGAWFRNGECEIHLGVETNFAPARKAHPAFRVAALDALADELASSNFPVRWDSDIKNRRRFFTSDPAGNRIEFMEE